MNDILSRLIRGLVLSLSFLFLFSITLKAQTISLKGKWRFKIDSGDLGVKDKWFTTVLPESVDLPGSMAGNLKGDEITLKTKWTGSIYDSSWYYNPHLAKFRAKGNIKIPFWLTPKKHYTGAAWYQKKVTVPANWKGQRVVLSLEYAHSETRLWLDDTEIGKPQYTFVVAQNFELPANLKPGKHTLTLRIDNAIKAINVGQDSHSLTDHTQGNWNGVVGKMELAAGSSVYFEDVQVYPDLKNKLAKVNIRLKAPAGTNTSGKITLSAISFNANTTLQVKPVTAAFGISNGDGALEVILPMGDKILTWDEFDPALYRLNASLTTNDGKKDQKQVQFGMREFKAVDRHFEINGRPVFLRGTVNNCEFPLTGYPAMNVESWIRIFKISRAHGLNHMRFHSWCPPEAAFIAADQVGFYLQPEGPSWANHGSSIGEGKPIDQFIYDETNRISKNYGNYASFCMLAYGNEPRGRQVEYLTKFNNYWRAKDSRRLYTGASVGGSWPVIPNNEFMVRAGARGLDWNRRPESIATYSKQIAQFSVPFVAHEMGQYCVFPNFKEIKKYTGIYRAKNFELFEEDLKDQGMGDQAEAFLMASGKLQALCYKNEIEKALRTPNYSGFQLLSLNDYPGQGTALIGVLDAFWDEKGYITAKQFNRFCNSTVPLARIPKFVFQNNESFEAGIEVANYGKAPITNARLSWIIKEENGPILATGSFEPKTLEITNCIQVGEVKFPLTQIKKASQLRLEVSIDGTTFANDWDFWVYPVALPQSKTSFYYCTSLDDQAKKVLDEGGNVFLNAAGKVMKGKEVVQTFLPVFWNTSWFKMRPPHTLGFVCDPKHPAFENFPTSDHSDMQWWEIVNKTQVMNLEDFPKGFRPIVQPIDTWFLNRRLAMIFEARVGKGKLIVSSADLNPVNTGSPASKQLFFSLQQYMQSDKFRPKFSVDYTVVKDLFEIGSKTLFSTYTKDSPDELKPQAQNITQAIPSKEKVLESLELTNAYFMNKWPDAGKTIITNKERPSNIWTRAVYYEGLMSLYQIKADKTYYDYAVQWGEKHKWGLRDGVGTRDADNQACGQTYIDLYHIDKKPERIKDIKASIDLMMKSGKIDDWTWIDALQMGMPVFAKLGALYHDPSYYEYMYKMYMHSKNVQGGGLYNAKDGLWWRDKDFVPPYKEPNGEDCYWSRGNGWVVAALVRVLQIMPKDGPHRDEYLKTYHEMIKALVPIQRTDGFWNVSLHDSTHFGGKETSGTALFVYGMAWGVNQGILDKKVFTPIIAKAWNALAKDAVHKNGFLGYLQGTGKEPKDGQPVSHTSIPDFEDYGLGCYLLAGTEVFKMKR